MAFMLPRGPPDPRRGYHVTVKNPDPEQATLFVEYMRRHKVLHNIGPLVIYVTPEMKVEMMGLVDNIKFTPTYYMWQSGAIQDYIVSNEVYLRALDESSWSASPERIPLFLKEMDRGNLEQEEWNARIIASYFMLINAFGLYRIKYSPGTKFYEHIGIASGTIEHFYDVNGNLKEAQ